MELSDNEEEINNKEENNIKSVDINNIKHLSNSIGYEEHMSVYLLLFYYLEST